MYVNEELLKREYDNPKIKLKDMLQEILENAKKNYIDRGINVTYILQSIGCINKFCEDNNFKKIEIEHNHPNKGGYCYEMIQHYQSEFLVENTDLYSEYFSSYRYEFKPEKIEEIKGLLKNIKQDIISNHNQAENTEIIIEIIDEMENDLKPKTNTLNNIKGKLILLHAEVMVLGVDTDELKSEIKSIYKILLDVDTFVNTVISLKDHISDWLLPK